MVQSQMFQQLLARVPACAGSHKFWAIGGQWLISSKILCSESMENLFFAGFLLVYKHPQVERKWQMKGNYMCVAPWFLPSPEICFGTYISFKSSRWLQLQGIGIGPARKSVRNTQAIFFKNCYMLNELISTNIHIIRGRWQCQRSFLDAMRQCHSFLILLELS